MPQNDVRPSAPELTDLQLKCLDGFWNRKPAKQIAAELDISEGWVHKNLMAVRRQLHVSSSADAAAIVFGAKPGSIKTTTTKKLQFRAPALPPMIHLPPTIMKSWKGRLVSDC